ncbi:MAG: terpene synthase family protein [Gammaproteobacteria bacterium]
MTQNFTIPAIYCPFSSEISPHADGLQQHTLEWVREFELVSDDKAWRRLEASKFGRLAARAYPHAPMDRLEIVSDWNTWLFVLDDQCDEWGLGKEPDRLAVLHERCLEILAGGTPGVQDVALVHAIHDIRERIQALMPLSWLTRFIQSAAEYFESTEWEAENRQSNSWPEAETYIRMRPYTGGLLTDIDLIELTESISLPLEVRKHPCIRELTEITNNVVCWSNDIISLQKERKHEDMHNLALIFHHHQSIGIQDAIDRVNELIEKEVQRFISLEQALPRFGAGSDEDAARLVGVLRAWMRGNLDWSFESGRYLPADTNASERFSQIKNKKGELDPV